MPGTILSYYPCGEVSGNLLDSVGGKTFTIAGDTWPSVAGAMGNARAKNSAASYFIRTADPFEFSGNQRTILFWVKRADTTISGPYDTIISQQDVPTFAAIGPFVTYFAPATPGAGLPAEAILVDLFTSGYIGSLFFNETIQVDTWYFVAIRIDDINKVASITVAEDGDTSVPAAYELSGWSGDLAGWAQETVLGADANGASTPVSGNLPTGSGLDELYIIDGILTDEEINDYLVGSSSSSASASSQSSSSSSSNSSSSSSTRVSLTSSSSSSTAQSLTSSSSTFQSVTSSSSSTGNSSSSSTRLSVTSSSSSSSSSTAQSVTSSSSSASSSSSSSSSSTNDPSSFSSGSSSSSSTAVSLSSSSSSLGHSSSSSSSSSTRASLTSNSSSSTLQSATSSSSSSSFSSSSSSSSDSSQSSSSSTQSDDFEAEIVPTGSGQGLYFLRGRAVRRMKIGTDWSVLNLGVRFRQSRTGMWSEGSILSGNRRVGFGLCSGTSNPYGSVSPTYFIGIKTNLPAWTRHGIFNWWETGWALLTRAGATETTHDSGTEGTLRVSEREEEQASAWYLRFSKLSASTLQVDAFLPTGPNAPTEFDFLTQLDREQFCTSVNNHSSYQEFSSQIPLDEATLGALDSFNIFSDLVDFTGVLRGIEWLNCRAERIA